MPCEMNNLVSVPKQVAIILEKLLDGYSVPANPGGGSPCLGQMSNETLVFSSRRVAVGT